MSRSPRSVTKKQRASKLPQDKETLVKKVENKIYDYNSIPEWLRDNEYILRGYRVGLTYKECIKSIFLIHNETSNIWTHFLGNFYFLGVMIWLISFEDSAKLRHRLIGSIFLISAMNCMFSSTIYHIFRCRSKQIDKFLERFDGAGIILLIASSIGVPIYFCFYCVSFWHSIYLASISFIGISGYIFFLSPISQNPKVYPFKAAILVLTALSGIIPGIHGIFLEKSPTNTLTILSDINVWIGVVQMYILYGLGGIIKAKKFPEMLSKGTFDYFLSSHQLWHILVFCATVVHDRNITYIYQQWSENNTCNALST